MHWIHLWLVPSSLCPPVYQHPTRTAKAEVKGLVIARWIFLSCPVYWEICLFARKSVTGMGTAHTFVSGRGCAMKITSRSSLSKQVLRCFSRYLVILVEGSLTLTSTAGLNWPESDLESVESTPLRRCFASGIFSDDALLMKQMGSFLWRFQF